jgi:UDP-GlcNAc:undecaprenyl-phosphate GlcNAc-1-phosphate transferase
MTLEAILKYPAVFVMALGVALLVTPMWRRLAATIGFLDYPGERKLHRSPMPVGGGVAIAVGFHMACALVFLYPWQPFVGQVAMGWWLRFLPLSIGVLALGLVDDRFSIRPDVKLAGQIVLAFAAYASGIRLQNVLGMHMPEWLNLLGTIVWFLTMMNAFNLIDGIDGLASGIGMIAALGIGISLVFRQSPGDVLLFLALAGACLGFLRYNFYPAQVFLGDTGSLFIGFTLAALAISTRSKGPALAVIGMPLLAIGVPLFDTVLAIWRRTVRRFLGQRGVDGNEIQLQTADAEHLHHRLLMTGRHHDEVALMLYGSTALLSVVGVLVSIFHDRAIGILGLGFVITTYTVFRHLAWIELHDSGRVVLKGIRRPVHRNRTLIFYLLFDVVALNLAWLASTVLVDMQDGVRDVALKMMWLRSVPVDVVIPLLILILFRAYSRVWYLARVAEYAATGMAVLFGIAIACGLNLVSNAHDTSLWSTLLHHLLMAGMAIPAVVGVRAALRVVQDLMQSFQRCADDREGICERVVVWGAGYRTTLFAKQVAFSPEREQPLQIVAIFSADEAIIGHYVHGIRVSGGIQLLRRFVEEKRINTVYIVEAVSASQREAICRAVAGTNVRVMQWDIVESACC